MDEQEKQSKAYDIDFVNDDFLKEHAFHMFQDASASLDSVNT